LPKAGKTHTFSCRNSAMAIKRRCYILARKYKGHKKLMIEMLCKNIDKIEILNESFI
jgi:hypothetical protein